MKEGSRRPGGHDHLQRYLDSLHGTPNPEAVIRADIAAEIPFCRDPKVRTALEHILFNAQHPAQPGTQKPNEERKEIPESQFPTKHGTVVYDPARFVVKIPTPEKTLKEIKIRPTDGKILEFLVSDPIRVWTKEEIEEKLWIESAYQINNRYNVKTHIGNLRERLGPDLPIYNIIGKGYTLTSDEDAVKFFQEHPEEKRPYFHRVIVAAGNLVLFSDRNIVISPLLSDRFIKLPSNLTAYLLLLMSNPKRVFSTEALASTIKIEPEIIIPSDLHSVKVQMTVLRGKLGDTRTNTGFSLIHAIRGTHGYTLTPNP